MKRRIVSVLTALALFLGLCPFSAFAAGASGLTLELHTQTTEVTNKKDAEHYEWKDLTVESSTTIKKGTLVLYNGFNAEKVTLPGEGAEVTIDIQGNSTIETLAYSRSGSASIQLTFMGTKGNTLTIANHINFAGDNNSTITVAENAVVEANNGISVGQSGGTDGTVTVKGTLTANAGVYIDESGNESLMSAINTGKVKIGANGKLTVRGSEGVRVNGNLTDGGGLDFIGAFSIDRGGTFDAECDEYNFMVDFGTNPPTDVNSNELKNIIVLPDGYLSDGYFLDYASVHSDSSHMGFASITDEGLKYEGYIPVGYISGRFLLHEDHKFYENWEWNETHHWKECKYRDDGCKQTQGYAEHTTNWIITQKSEDDKTPIKSKKCSSCSYVTETDCSYKVNVNPLENGKVTIDPTYKDSTIEDSTIDRTYAFSEDTVTLTVEPDDGYVLTADAINIFPTSKSRNTLDVKQVGDNKYTFTMPDGPVTVTAAFTEKGPDTPGGSGNPGGGGGSSGSYTIKIEKPEHGEVTSDRRYTDQGELVRLTVKPDSGYRLTGLTVTDGRGNEIAVTEEADGTFTFTMPNSSVTVRASFGPDGQSGCGGGIDCPSRAYRDLDTSQWYHLAVDYVLRNGLMSGYGNQTFGPNDPLTRAQFAQILYNKAGRPAVTGSSPFTDVDPGEWFAPAVSWAAERGVVNGYGNGLFGPNDPITREQLAAMLWRYSDCPEPTISQLDFTDAGQISPYALAPLRWAVQHHVVNGLGNRVLDPQGLASRAQIAQMLLNLFGG